MNKRRLAICDSEEEYLRGIRDYLSMRDTFPFVISIYSSVELVNIALSKGMIDVLLIQDSLYEALGDIEKIKKTENLLLILLDTGNSVNNISAIWKYQSVEVIRREIMKYYAEYQGKEEAIKPIGNSTINRSRETSFIGIYTPIGRCLQTSYALALGQQLAKKAPTLYLNFESFSGLDSLLGSNDEKDITDLVFFLRSNSESLVFQLESMVCRVGSLDYVYPASSFIDLGSADESDWQKLLKVLAGNHSYEYIILDLSEIVSGLLDILRECGKIYMICEEDVRSKAKIYQYEKLLMDREYGDVVEKTTRIIIPKGAHEILDTQSMDYGELAEFAKERVKEDFGYGI